MQQQNGGGIGETRRGGYGGQDNESGMFAGVKVIKIAIQIIGSSDPTIFFSIHHADSHRRSEPWLTRSRSAILEQNHEIGDPKTHRDPKIDIKENPWMASGIYLRPTTSTFDDDDGLHVRRQWRPLTLQLTRRWSREEDKVIKLLFAGWMLFGLCEFWDVFYLIFGLSFI